MTTIHHGLDSNLGGIAAGLTDKTSSAQGQTAQTQAQAQPTIGAPSSEVEITPAAQLLANVAQQLSGGAPVDQSRVDAIRKALNEGTYQINSGRIADGLFNTHKLDTQAASGSSSNPVKAFAQTAQLGSDSK